MHFVLMHTAAHSLNVLFRSGRVLIFPHRKSKQLPLCRIPQLGDHNCVLNELVHVLSASFSDVAT